MTSLLPRPPGRALPNYGRGNAVISVQEMIRLDPDVLAGRLLNFMTSPSYRPPVLPPAAARILMLAANPATDAREMVEALGTDPMLMGHVTRTAQSPAYGGQRVPTLQDAVQRLGVRGLRNVVVEVALELRVFRTPVYAECMESVHRHSLVTAHLCHLVARATRVDPNEAFLAGLLHDVGLAAGLLTVADGFRKEAAPPLQRYWGAIEAAHLPAGRVMLHAWGLSDGLAEAVARSHDPFDGRAFVPLAGCIVLADHLARRLGAPVHVDERPGSGAPIVADATDPARILAARDAFGLRAAELQRLADDAAELYPRIGWGGPFASVPTALAPRGRRCRIIRACPGEGPDELADRLLRTGRLRGGLRWGDGRGLGGGAGRRSRATAGCHWGVC